MREIRACLLLMGLTLVCSNISAQSHNLGSSNDGGATSLTLCANSNNATSEVEITQTAAAIKRDASVVSPTQAIDSEQIAPNSGSVTQAIVSEPVNLDKVATHSLSAEYINPNDAKSLKNIASKSVDSDAIAITQHVELEQVAPNSHSQTQVLVSESVEPEAITSTQAITSDPIASNDATTTQTLSSKSKRKNAKHSTRTIENDVEVTAAVLEEPKEEVAQVAEQVVPIVEVPTEEPSPEVTPIVEPTVEETSIEVAQETEQATLVELNEDTTLNIGADSIVEEAAEQASVMPVETLPIEESSIVSDTYDIGIEIKDYTIPELVSFANDNMQALKEKGLEKSVIFRNYKILVKVLAEDGSEFSRMNIQVANNVIYKLLDNQLSRTDLENALKIANKEGTSLIAVFASFN